MKNVYDAPVMEVIRLEEQDVIATSNASGSGVTYTLTYDEENGISWSASGGNGSWGKAD